MYCMIKLRNLLSFGVEVVWCLLSLLSSGMIKVGMKLCGMFV